MPRGRPDFFGTPIHERYGVCKQANGFETAEFMVEKELVNVSAKGMLAGGFVSTIDTDALPQNVVGIKIDGNWITSHAFIVLLNQGIFSGTDQPMVLVRYMPDLPAYSVAFPIDLPFETSISFWYMNTAVNPVVVSYWLVYYDIEA